MSTRPLLGTEEFFQGYLMATTFDVIRDLLPQAQKDQEEILTLKAENEQLKRELDSLRQEVRAEQYDLDTSRERIQVLHGCSGKGISKPVRNEIAESKRKPI
jgi:hypothetical protein